MVRKLDAEILSHYPQLWSQDTAIRSITERRVVPMIPRIAELAGDCLQMDLQQMSLRMMKQCTHILLGFGRQKVSILDFFRRLFGSRTRAWRLMRPVCVERLGEIVGRPIQTTFGAIVDDIRTHAPEVTVGYRDRMRILGMFDRKDLGLLLRRLRA